MSHSRILSIIQVNHRAAKYLSKQVSKRTTAAAHFKPKNALFVSQSVSQRERERERERERKRERENKFERERDRA